MQNIWVLRDICTSLHFKYYPLDDCILRDIERGLFQNMWMFFVVIQQRSSKAIGKL